MSNILNITDLKKLRITKIKGSYAVYFEYDGQKYMLHDDSDEDRCIGLYVRDNDNPQKVIRIAGAITLAYPIDFIRDISHGKPTHISYAHVDREFFAKKMIQHELCEGKYKKEYENHLERVNCIQKEIDKLKLEISELSANQAELKKNWLSTNNVGSRQDTNEIKLRVAERVKGKQAGEWCDDYKAYYGDTDPVYGGTLTDLFTLPVGTRFYVENGGYSACIGVNNHGDKVIVTDESVVKLTAKHCSAFITRYDTKE